MIAYFFMLTMMSPGLDQLKAHVKILIAGQDVQYGIAFHNLATGEELLIDAHARMHAASTMKVPVMMRLFEMVELGEITLDQTLLVHNRFKSIVDDSSFSITVDSDEDLHDKLGSRVTIQEMIRLMIVRSSNLATNLLIELAGAKKTTVLMRQLDARDIRVLRGVEDILAFEKGLNNEATAHDMMQVMIACATSNLFSVASRETMLEILRGQEFLSMIPAGLPDDSGAVVANKTGSISRVQHDCAVIDLPNGNRYILVVFSRFTPNDEYQRGMAVRTSRHISRAVYNHVKGRFP